MPNWHTEQVRLGDLVEWEKNPRQLSKHDAEHIGISISKFGLADPLVVNADHSLIGGHQRKRVMLLNDYTKDSLVDVRVPDRQLTEREAEELAIRLNKNAGNWDWDMLANEFEIDDLVDWGFSTDELEGLDFGDEPVEDVEPQIDKAEELREKWGVETGQLWKLGEHRLICGDCTDKAVVDRVMGGEKADMVFTDPPYGVGYVGKTKDKLTIARDDVTEEELVVYVKQWFDACADVSRPGAYWLATVPARPLHVIFLSDWKERGILRQVMVWVKDSMVLGHSEYHYRHEPILFGWVKGDRLNNTDRTKTTVWEFDRPKASREHPTMKPIEMWEYGIGNHTNVGDLLFEPFSGSGTTILACERLNRRCNAIEIEEKYTAVAIQRWADATGGEPELVVE